MDFPISGSPVGYQQITSVSGVVGLTVPAGATQALVSIAGKDVRFRNDGSNPSATVGFPLPAAQQFWFIGNLSALKFIETASAAAIDVIYFK